MSTPTAARSVSLDDKYDQRSGRVLISGTQALVRLPLLQSEFDRSAGLATAGYISGYRGSPLGGVDMSLARERKRLEEHNIVFHPGVNEELAATAIWGTQQLDMIPGPTVDGVFAYWYGKGPGVDRATDALRHGNYAGSHARGGVLVVYGDDHPGKSSTVAHQSEQTLAAVSIPSLYPASVHEFLRFGLLGWALSRYCGLWIGFKCVNETVEQTATVEVDLDGFKVVLPERGALPPEGVNLVPRQFNPQQAEIVVTRYRLPLVHRFVRANGIDRVGFGMARPRFGIVTAGKAFEDVLQALRLLAIDNARAEQLGIGVYKVGCIWPLEPTGLREFAEGCDELLFVEEKRGFVETQAAAQLYSLKDRPRIVGKHDENGAPLLPADVQLQAHQVAAAIAARLRALGQSDQAIAARAELLTGRAPDLGAPLPLPLNRMPFYCSGCPHSTSTKVPEGSIAMAGIGCHAMAMMANQQTLPPTQMGGEGANWIGASNFTRTRHVFQNLGDGTFYHSGLLAVRAAVASGVNITFKILYNQAVAMTGGQPHDGPVSVSLIAHQVIGEGVTKCVVVTDNPGQYDGGRIPLPPGVTVHHRDDLPRLQLEMREIEGCTAIVYDQACAAERRRWRKKKSYPDPAKRMFIYDPVCEGCGDCSVQATCVSILPKDTPLGTKREIDQSSCNKDYSCVKGFCPSFVTVLDAQPRKPKGVAHDDGSFADLPTPQPAPIGAENYGVLVSGIGGTGVITVGAVLGMAAHVEGKACSIYDMTGLAQKNGAVFSHLRIAQRNEDISAQRVGRGDGDLVLGFDELAALNPEAFGTIMKGRTHFVGNSQVAPTFLFQLNPLARPPIGIVEAKIRNAVGDDRAHFIDATGLALALCGDTVAVNMMMLGYAAQKGLLPVGIDAILGAIKLNGVAVEFNVRTFNYGRLWAHDPAVISAKVQGHAALAKQAPMTLDQVIEHRTKLLTDYQNAAWAQRYRALVDEVSAAESKVKPGSTALAMASAQCFAKLMSYKDEYEVARLYASPDFARQLAAQFEDGGKLKFNLAPPLLSRRDPVTGHLRKREFGGWMLSAFKLLARFRGLRGSALDIFGHSVERRGERRLIDDYEAMIKELLPSLSAASYDSAVALAQIPDLIKGYGHVKERNLAAAMAKQAELLAAYRNPPVASAAPARAA